MLTLCDQSFDPIWTDFGSWVTFTPAWREAVNAMGEIPVLVDDSVSLTQTAPILLRLSERYGKFGGTSETECFEVLRWLFWDNQKLSGFMATYRFQRTFSKRNDPAVLAYLKSRVDDCLKVLEQHLQARAFVIGDAATIADLSMCAYLSFPSDETGYELAASHPKVDSWLKRIAAIPGWKSPYDLLPGARLKRYDQAHPGSPQT